MPAPAAAAAGWSRPFALSPPRPSDVAGAQVAFAPSGEAAVAFDVGDEDNPAATQAYVTVRSAGGDVAAPRRIPGAQQVLALTFDGPTLELLTGTARAGYACCSSVGLGRAFAPRRTVVSGLAGPARGSLTASPPSRLLAAVATDHGVWVARSGAGRRVSAAGQTPWTLALAPSGTVAWTATVGVDGETAPSSIFTTSGTRAGGRVAATAAAGHQIDELSLMQGRGMTTAAWGESWIDASGAYRSQVVVRDLRAGAVPRVFAVQGRTASGLAAASDAAGDQVMAWRACDQSVSCRLWAVSRRAGARFRGPVELGEVDPYEDPAAAVSNRGQSLVGWISGGRVLAAARLGHPRVIAGRGDAGGLTLAFGPGRDALAAWTAGSATEQLLGAIFDGG